MRTVDLNELSVCSPWPARLLGLSPWEKPTRDLDRVREEYDGDKYADCLAWARAGGVEIDAEAVKAHELGGDLDREVCYSDGSELVLDSLGAARSAYCRLLADRLGPVVTDTVTVIELGCGYGYNLWRLGEVLEHQQLLGGELSHNAVELARSLHGPGGPEVRPFNFYCDADYDLIRNAEGPVVVFTSHAVEQLPTALPLVESLVRCGDRLQEVVHFEPVVEAHDPGLLGLMRRRYAEVNDYNRDLVTVLDEHRAVDLIEADPDVLGVNPMNPTSVIRWRLR